MAAVTAGKYVDIEIGGVTRRLRLDMAALAEAEQITGDNWLSNEPWSNMSAKRLITIVYAAMHGESDRPSMAALGGMIDFGSIPDLIKPLTGLLENPDAEKAGDEAPLE